MHLALARRTFLEEDYPLTRQKKKWVTNQGNVAHAQLYILRFQLPPSGEQSFV